MKLSWDESIPFVSAFVLAVSSRLNFKLADTIPALSMPTNTFTFSVMLAKVK